MDEIWKPIAGYEGIYEISNLGRVKSLNYHRSGKECVLKPNKHNCGYIRATLSNGGHMLSYYVHRLVAEAFIPNPDHLPQVNHIDEDKTNNRVDNLEWCTAKYNNNYGTGKDRQVTARSKAVKQLTLNGEFITKWKSANEAGRKNGISNSHICDCCNGKQRQTGGYKWEWAS